MTGCTLSKIQKSFRSRGLLGSCRRAANKVADWLVERTPTRRRSRQLKAQRDRVFDGQFGVDTGGVIQPGNLDAPAGKEHGMPYWAIGPEEFALAMSSIAIRHEEFTFVDLGSGKGRALMLASEFPFKKIMGVEFSPQLHEVAQQNLRQFQNPRQQCKQIEAVCMDATQFEFPLEPLVVYLFNPFDSAIMTPVIERLRKSHAEKPRAIYVLYCNPQLADLWEKTGAFEKISSAHNCATYRLPSGQA